jgi:hypothetical protein
MIKPLSVPFSKFLVGLPIHTLAAVGAAERGGGT